METFEGKGSCLCGAVTFTANNARKGIEACHCGMCRTWGGGPLMVSRCGSDVAFDGEDNISVYPSSEWAERGFCNVCGSHLFFRLKDTHTHFIPVGLFEHQEAFTFRQQCCVDRKPSFYAFANRTTNLTEAQLLGT